VGSTSFAVPASTDRDSRDWILVFTDNDNGKEIAPSFIRLLDNTTVAPNDTVSNLVFADADQTIGNVDGIVFWAEPPDLAEVRMYSAYLAESNDGTGGLSIGEWEPDVHVNNVTVQTTPRDARDWVLVYTKNDNGRAPVATAIILYDARPTVPPIASTVSMIYFVDTDDSEYEVSGVISWVEPVDLATFTSYAVYLGKDANVTPPLIMVGSDVPVGTNELVVPANFSTADGYDTILVYTKNIHGVQQTPFAVRLLDETDIVPRVSVSALLFSDMDADSDKVSGTVYWTEPAELASVRHYAVFLAEDVIGSGKLQEGSDTVVGTNQLFVADSTARDERDHVLVYTKNKNGEQVTPVAIVLEDNTTVQPPVSVSDIAFTDIDSTQSNVSGTVYYLEPPNMATVRNYILYFADDTAQNDPASHMSQVGGDYDVFVGSTSLNVPASAMRDFRDWILVFTRNDNGRELDPSFIRLLDNTTVPPVVVVSNLNLQAMDPTVGDVSGDVF